MDGASGGPVALTLTKQGAGTNWHATGQEILPEEDSLVSRSRTLPRFGRGGRPLPRGRGCPPERASR